MKKIFLILFVLLFVCGCTSKNDDKSYLYNIKKIDCIEKETLVSEGAILIDVRSESEFLEGHLDDAVNMEYGYLKTEASSIIDSKDTKIIVYCRSGRRSGIAAETLASMGYTNIYDLGSIDNCSVKA